MLKMTEANIFVWRSRTSEGHVLIMSTFLFVFANLKSSSSRLTTIENIYIKSKRKLEDQGSKGFGVELFNIFIALRGKIGVRKSSCINRSSCSK